MKETNIKMTNFKKLKLKSEIFSLGHKLKIRKFPKSE